MVVEPMVKRLRAREVDAAKSEKRAYGVVVPIPTLPPFATMKLVCVEEPTTNCGPLMPLGFTERRPQGVVEAIPTEPPVVAKYAEPEEVSAVVEAYGKTEAKSVEVAR